jgi:hypothetical protein
MNPRVLGGDSRSCAKLNEMTPLHRLGGSIPHLHMTIETTQDILTNILTGEINRHSSRPRID